MTLAILKTLCILSILALMIDCKQTLNIKKHPTEYETNKLLGLHPSDALVIRYFAAYIVAVVLGYFYAPPVIFTGGCIGLIAVESYVIYGNTKLGL